MPSVRRPTRPTPQWQVHAARASTPDERLAVAYDRLRANLTHLRRRRRDPLVRAADSARADSLAADATTYLTSLCEQAEEGDSQ